MQYALLLLGGGLMGITFLIPYSWPLAVIACLPIFKLLRTSSVRMSYVYGFAWSYLFIACALYPVFWSPLPLDWAEIEGHIVQQYVFAFVAWSLSTAIFAAPFALWGAVARHLLLRPDARMFWLLPSAWVLAEYAGTLLFSLFNYAPGVAIGVQFSLTFIGNVLADDIALRQLAIFGGVYALSALLIAGNIVVDRIVTGSLRGTWVIRSAVILFIVWALTSLALKMHTDTGSTVVAVTATQVHPTLHLSNERFEKYLATGKSMYEQAILSGAEIIVFPEGSAFMVPRDSRGVPLVMTRASSTPPSVITSQRIMNNGHILSQMEYYDFSRGTISYTYKYLPQPIGEYMTSSAYWTGTLLGARSTMDQIAQKGSHISGLFPSPQIVGSIKVGALFCNETLSPDLYSSLARTGADLFINASSQDWFHESKLVHLQLLRAAQIRATESHRYYIQSSNTSPAFVLNYYGRLLAESAWHEEGVLISNIETSNVLTPYSLLGSRILVLPLGAIVYLLYMNATRPRRGIQS